MAKKSNAQKKKEKSTLLGSIVSVIISAALLVISVTKEGPFGQISNNIFSFFFGRFFVIILVVSIITGLAECFKHKFHLTFHFGIVIFTIAAFVLSGIIFNNGVNTFAAYKDFIADYWLKFYRNEVFDFGGGLIGNGLYVLFITLIDRKLTIVFTIFALLSGILLLIPFSWYKDVHARSKERREELKAERLEEAKARQQERKEAKEEKERLARIRLQEKRRQEELEAQRRSEQTMKFAEEANKELENDSFEIEEEVIKETKKPLDMSSSSQYFIDMTNGSVPIEPKPQKEHKSEEFIGLNQNSKASTLKDYEYPSLRCLERANKTSSNSLNEKNAEEKGKRLIEILKTFDIEAELLNCYIGPSVTKFEIKPDINVKVNKILSIQDNIKMELAAKDIRIEAPISGKNAVGVEIPNAEKTPVKMIEMMKDFEINPFNTTFALGKDLFGKNVTCNIAKMPHVLIAGATGSGKSVCENAIITSILLRSDPKCVKLVLIDPKKVEFSPYHDIPHLLWPVITDSKMAVMMLEKLVIIMEKRYEDFAECNCKNIETYNKYINDKNKDLPEGIDPTPLMPYIIVIIDELADLMSTSKNEVVGSIQRITQLARASGIHLVVATQRPSTDIINGVIKNNIPSRIAFSMPTSTDSRTVLDSVGAERLLGSGDMLYSPQGEPAPIRLQGVYVTDNEIERITKEAKKVSPVYDDTYYDILNNNENAAYSDSSITNTSENDPLYDEVVEYVKTAQKASTSLLQRRFGIGYNRAARLIDTLEDKNIIGPSNGSKPREVLIKDDSDD